MNLSTAEYIRSLCPDFRWLNRKNKSEIKKVYEQALKETKQKIEDLYADKTSFSRALTLWKDRWFLEYVHHWFDARLGHWNNVAKRYAWILKSLRSNRQADSTKNITDSDIDRAKQVPIEQLYGGTLRSVAGRLSGLCPFHTEKTPSFFIYKDNHYHCFGCGSHGDAITFIRENKKIGFQEAVKFLLHN